ncbi:MAG TPA: helix-turn-helix domain-containing protein [Candidatus Limnocylindria bacterium]
MDGYTVEEAAEVLGIPQGRVWELIARGVLSGAAEGRADMRVFLKPAAGERPSATGNGGSAERSGESGEGEKGASAIEASPFRELLTEFRNLTERYGQALLALGEARGEVAALRSRVEVLEARMDMRLPLRAASTVAWEMPDRYAAESAAQAGPPLPPQPGPMPLHPPEAPPEPMPGLEDQAPTAESEPSPEQSAVAVPGEVDEAPAVAAPAPELPTPSPLDEPPEVPVVLHSDAAEAEASDQPKRRVSGGRAAVAGLAEALARAEDPTLADLPGASDAAEALAALQRETQAAAEPEPPAADESEGEPQPPREAAEESAPPEAEQAASAPPMAEPEEEPPAPTTMEFEVEEEPRPEPTAEPQAPSVYSTEVVEPDWFADGDFTWLDASSREGEPEEPAAASEAEHLDREEEGPAAEAIQEAFHEPAPMAPDEAPVATAPDQASPADATEAEHLDREEEGPAVGAIQEAFDEPDVAHSTESAPAWPHEDQPPVQDQRLVSDQPPHQDRPPVTGSGSVGFGLFRTDEDRQRAHAPAAGTPGSGTPGAGSSGSDAAQEEALLWFGDEFEAADELEVAAPGWRDQERLEATPPGAVALDEHVEERPSDEQIDRLAEEGWGSDEVEAIRSYLGRAGQAGPEPSKPPAPTPPTDRAAEQPTGQAPEQPAAPTAEPAPEPGPEPMPSPGLDQDWLRGRRGPAATAYRRLRRLFDS